MYKRQAVAKPRARASATALSGAEAALRAAEPAERDAERLAADPREARARAHALA